MAPMPNNAKRASGRALDIEGSGLLDYAGAAEYLATTERHVRQLWNQREIAAVKVGKLVRFQPADLDAYIRRRKVEAVHWERGAK